MCHLPDNCTAVDACCWSAWAADSGLSRRSTRVIEEGGRDQVFVLMKRMLGQRNAYTRRSAGLATSCGDQAFYLSAIYLLTKLCKSIGPLESPLTKRDVGCRVLRGRVRSRNLSMHTHARHVGRAPTTDAMLLVSKVSKTPDYWYGEWFR